MIHDLKQHPVAYTFLTLLLTLGVVCFLAAWPNRTLQQIVAIGMGATYFGWGIITHVKSDHINRRIVFEYLTISALASLLLLLVTI